MSAYIPEEPGIGELLGHQTPKREQRLLKPHQKQTEPDDHKYKSHENLIYVGNPLAQDEQLKRKQEQDDRCNVLRTIKNE